MPQDDIVKGAKELQKGSLAGRVASWFDSKPKKEPPKTEEKHVNWTPPDPRLNPKYAQKPGPPKRKKAAAKY